jgi:hypothetical protein
VNARFESRGTQAGYVAQLRSSADEINAAAVPLDRNDSSKNLTRLDRLVGGCGRIASGYEGRRILSSFFNSHYSVRDRTSYGQVQNYVQSRYLDRLNRLHCDDFAVFDCGMHAAAARPESHAVA